MAVLKPLALLLQETRTPCKIPNYTTFVDPTIPTYTQHRTRKHFPGQAAILVHNSCQAVQHKWDKASTEHREVIIVRVVPPGGKPMLLVSVYYPPARGSVPATIYDWIPYLRSLNFSGPILVGGDFNARNTLWGYPNSDTRGKLLEQALEFSPLHIRNEPGFVTRIGLHSAQSDTTPDLTLATHGAIRTWRTHDTTWVLPLKILSHLLW